MTTATRVCAGNPAGLLLEAARDYAIPDGQLYGGRPLARYRSGAAGRLYDDFYRLSLRRSQSKRRMSASDQPWRPSLDTGTRQAI